MKKYVRLSRLVVSLGLTAAISAQALTLGKLSVLSSIGQPLIAEIEVPEISTEEVTSFRAGIASAEAFKSAGLDYTAAVALISITPKRRTNGRVILEIRTTQPVSAPYLDLVIEVTWTSGRILRDYTVLLDAPASPTQALITPLPTLPIQSSLSIAAPTLSDLVPSAAQVTATELEPLTASVPSAPMALPNVRAATAVAARVKQVARPESGMTTKRGDTAAALARDNKPEGVSLDQMLVAMLRSNPDAFVEGNVNRLKTGVVLDMPGEEAARAASPSAARSSIQAQTRDFNEYRSKLSANVASTAQDDSARSASGKVVANVADRQAAPTADDRLTLAKPSATNPTTKAETNATETKIAQERAAADEAARASELKKNITDLNKLMPAVAASAPATVASATVPFPAPLPAPVQNPPKQNRPALPLPPEPSFLDQIISDPLTLPIAGGVGILVLLASWIGIRRRRASAFGRTQNSMQDFVASRQPSDTVFGPMGASDVNTRELPATNTAMVYSASQASPINGGVDPIAEADVYLAYNRDVQAEEILKAAKLENPKRMDVQLKLLEIYAKRRDADSFNAGAQNMHMLTDGAGNDWAKVRQLATEIGSTHPLFNASAPSVPQFEVNPDVGLDAKSTPAAGLIDFDLNTFSLDLPDFNAQKPHVDSNSAEDPKLALAEEYLSIGDHVGARALIEEVIQQSGHPQTVTQAHQMLARLG
jgi:pilus assembly protein FimV